MAYNKPMLVKPLRNIEKGLIVREGFYFYSGADTGNVLLRSKTLELLDPRVMFRLKYGEDFYIAQQIVKAGFYYIRNPRMLAYHYGDNVSFRIKKSVKRHIEENGLWLEMPYSVFVPYAAVRLFAAAFKNRLKLIDYVILSLLSPISYAKTKSLSFYAQKTSLHRGDHRINSGSSPQVS